ncbi:MAG TPA: LLM class F420-dependent oxidoreductase [Acidimicrobiia bacterium]|nr:LLM class F420-dependent oxidoreductase [Acidimicrobiia bacterium]
MKLGIVTPVVTRLPRAHAAWEETAGIDEIARVAIEADRLGYHHLTCSEHVALPREVVDTRGGTYWDPLPVFGYVAARTSTIRLATHVLVLGYHHPLAIAKRYGTLDRVSGGRLVLGVGVGSLQEEFELLGAQFEGRGERGDDEIRALRASLSQLEPEYRGSHYAYAGFVVDPYAVQPRVPIWVGGRTARSLRRAVELADGWTPFGLARAELATMIARARDSEAWAARRELAGAPAFELVLQNEHPFDPGAEPDRVRDAVERLVGAGATTLNVRFVHHSLEHYLEQLAAMRELVA